MEKANLRIASLQHDLKHLKTTAAELKDEDDSDEEDDDAEQRAAIMSEIEQLNKENKLRQDKLDEYEKNKTCTFIMYIRVFLVDSVGGTRICVYKRKCAHRFLPNTPFFPTLAIFVFDTGNVDNMCYVAEERTMINPDAAKLSYTETGFAKSTVDGSTVEIGKKENLEEESDAKPAAATPTASSTTNSATAATTTTSATNKPAAAKTTTTTSKPAATTTVATKSKESSPSPSGPSRDASDISIMSYYEFTQKYADTVEEFMKITDLEQSKEFLLKNGDILLQENASNYLLLASLEDEMNGYREKMKQTARQSQLISSIADLARSLSTHPGNVILPFFGRLQQKEYLEGFLAGVKDFQDKIIKRAVTKKIEMDREREAEEAGEASDLKDIPKEQRLGPGGLDPLEVIETLPECMQKAFESRDVEELKKALMSLDPKDAEYHMKRCVDSGLWNQS